MAFISPYTILTIFSVFRQPSHLLLPVMLWLVKLYDFPAINRVFHT